MVEFFLACVLWSKPHIEVIQVPVSEYAMADLNHVFGHYRFEATVVEEKMNSVKITHLPTGANSQAHAPHDYQQRSLSIRLEVKDDQASLDCDIRQKPQEVIQ